MLAFFSVTLKCWDFVYACLCLFNILLSRGVSDRLFWKQSLQTTSKHSTAASNRTIFNFPLLQRAGECDWEEHHSVMWLKMMVIIFISVWVCTYVPAVFGGFYLELYVSVAWQKKKKKHWWMKKCHFHSRTFPCFAFNEFTCVMESRIFCLTKKASVDIWAQGSRPALQLK